MCIKGQAVWHLNKGDKIQLNNAWKDSLADMINEEAWQRRSYTQIKNRKVNRLETFCKKGIYRTKVINIDSHPPYEWSE